MDDYIQMSPEIVDAKRRGDVERILQLVEAGEDLRAIDNQEGWSLLHWTAHHGHTELARELIDTGADIECRDEEGHTPLMLAAFAGQLDMVRLLMARGANPAAEAHGGDPAAFARLKKHTAIDLLLNMAKKQGDAAGKTRKRAPASWEREQARDNEVACELFLARPENRESTDPLVGVWQGLGSTQVHHSDGTTTTVRLGGRINEGPHWQATNDGDFIQDSSNLGIWGPDGEIVGEAARSRMRWRFSPDGNKLYLTNEGGAQVEFTRQDPGRKP